MFSQPSNTQLTCRTLLTRPNIHAIFVSVILLSGLNSIICYQNNYQLHSNASKETRSQSPVPEFVEPIGNHTVPMGKDAQLSCKVNNLGAHRTAWLRLETKDILTIHSNIITRNYRIGLINNDDGNSVLTIKNVIPSDKGGYLCQINSVPMKYAIGYLDVLTPPAFDEPTSWLPSDAVGSSDQPLAQPLGQSAPMGPVTVVEGANVSLSCRASGYPNPTISWRREDSEPILVNGPLSESGQVKIEGPSLTLNSVSRLSAGAYLCIASNGVQPSASKRQLLDVQFSPVLRLPQVELGAQLGQAEARLLCFVELNPAGSYHWVKLEPSQHDSAMATGSGGARAGDLDDAALIERDELTKSDKYDIVMKQASNEKVQMILIIRRIERSDFANYKCIARNSLGTQSNSVRLYELAPNSSPGQPMIGRPDSSDWPDNQTGRPGGANGGAPRASGAPSSRAHTRSSWLQGGKHRQGADSPAQSLPEARPSSGCPAARVPLLSGQAIGLLLALASALLLAPIAQMVVDLSGGAEQVKGRGRGRGRGSAGLAARRGAEKRGESRAG